MKTPYDAALRVLRRQVDDRRIALVALAGQAESINDARSALGDAIGREAALAAAQWDLPAYGYLARQRHALDRLVTDQHRADARLVALRQEAGEAFGALRAIEGAAETYLADAALAADNAEQREFDDSAAARFMRARRPMASAIIRSAA